VWGHWGGSASGRRRSAVSTTPSTTTPRRRRSTARGHSGCARSTRLRCTAPGFLSGGWALPYADVRATSSRSRPRSAGCCGAPPFEAYFDFSYDAALRSLDESLGRLGLDRVDIALIHDPDDHYDEALAGAYRALARLRDEGVVRAIGVGMNQTGLLCRFAREADPDCFLVAGRYTLLDRSAADELLPLCEERRIAVIAGGVFNSGVLADGDTYDYSPAPPAVLERATELRAICARRDVPLTAAAVQFPSRHPAVACVLVGCRSAQEVEADARLFDLELPESLWQELV
jgi:D-threo-aldose 1-dehydrogenase